MNCYIKWGGEGDGHGDAADPGRKESREFGDGGGGGEEGLHVANDSQREPPGEKTRTTSRPDNQLAKKKKK